MTALNLEPNEFVGYRIQPDWYSFNVVLVKRHGALSKQAGQEYGTTLAYCKTLAFATQWIVSHAARTAGAKAQDEAERATASVADTQALLGAFEGAVAQAMAAVAHLQGRIDLLGLDQKSLVKELRVSGGLPADEPA